MPSFDINDTRFHAFLAAVMARAGGHAQYMVEKYANGQQPNMGLMSPGVVAGVRDAVRETGYPFTLGNWIDPYSMEICGP